MRFDLSDEEWALLEPLMPDSRKSAPADDRKVMNAIFYVLRTGIPWRDLPVWITAMHAGQVFNACNLTEMVSSTFDETFRQSA